MRKEAPTVEKLLIKAERKKPMVVVSEGRVIVHERRGIEGDVNADPASPRQILLIQGETLEAHGLPYGALRENIVTRNIDLHTWESGAEIAVGREVTLRITFPCEICTLLTTLPAREPRALRDKRGVLAVVLTGGTVHVGDEMRNLGKKFVEVPTQIYERFVWLIRQIPAGTVLDYTTLIKVIGASSNYVHVVPGFIKRARAERLHLPLHRIVDTTGHLISYVARQNELLAREEVLVENNAVDLRRYRWDSTEVYYTVC